MKLNFDIICDFLQNFFPLQRYGTGTAALKILAPRFYTGECLPDYLYLVEADQPPLHFGAPAVWIGPADAVLEAPDCPLAVVEPSVSVPELMNTLLKAFDQYRTWDASLQECVTNRLGLRELTGRGAAAIPGRILTSDKRFVLLSDSHFYQAAATAPQNYQGETLPAEIIRSFSDTARVQTLRTAYFAGEEGQYDGHRVYCINIFLDNQYAGTCAMMEDSRAFRAGDFALFNHFYHYVCREFRFFLGTSGKQVQAQRKMLRTLLEQQMPDAETEAQMASYEQTCSDYRCLVLVEAKDQALPQEYLCFTIEQLYSGSIGIFYGNQVVALVPQWSEADLQKLLSVMEPLQLSMGLSNRGNQLCEVPALYRQACAALELGTASHAGGSIHTFAQYALPYLLAHSVGDFSPEAFQTEGFRQLEALNAVSTVDYLHTLQVYLDQEMNITESARRLYLHRSSFLKRLERIRELLGPELETPEGRLLLRWLLYQRQEP